MPEAEFVVGGRHYPVFAHDWRRLGSEAFMDLMGQRELDSGPGLATVPGAVTPEHVR
ncbi:MAG: hypothetical protein ACRD2C_19185 [Acidimicrobiales bacterium]